jgi:hypothetical protein
MEEDGRRSTATCVKSRSRPQGQPDALTTRLVTKGAYRHSVTHLFSLFHPVLPTFSSSLSATLPRRLSPDVLATEMSLPTPPSTGHREKENRVPLPPARVIWSPNNEYRILNSIPPQVSVSASASKTLPTKSILKKRSEVLLPLVDAFQRETTPEPSQPKNDPKYLSSPVTTIVDSSSSLDDLIRAYSVLAARIRGSITLTTDCDASLPILHPLRKNRVALEEAIVRDVARCLVDPETMTQTPEDMEEEACLKEQPVLLPSPKSSPKKKKKGTTAKKAKYGRDLCTTCHSVIKLLALIFTLPAVSAVFTSALRSLFRRSEANPFFSPPAPFDSCSGSCDSPRR